MSITTLNTMPTLLGLNSEGSNACRTLRSAYWDSTDDADTAYPAENRHG